MQARERIIGLAAVLLVMAAGCARHENVGETGMNDTLLKSDLELIARHRIFFGHQSVGVDIVQGLNDLKAETGTSQLTLINLGKEGLPQGPYFAEALIGKNSEPDSKCDMFGTVVGTLALDSLEIALMKFCYVDIKKGTNVEEMFRYYVATMEDLMRKYPRITFVHVTVPATERNLWWRRMVKKILGREEEWDIASVKRSAFNRMMRERYQGDPLFDLETVESTYPDGTRERFEADGNEAYGLVAAYTRDGGHLNARGRKLVARELVRKLAAILRTRAS